MMVLGVAKSVSTFNYLGGHLRKPLILVSVNIIPLGYGWSMYFNVVP